MKQMSQAHLLKASPSLGSSVLGDGVTGGRA